MNTYLGSSTLTAENLAEVELRELGDILQQQMKALGTQNYWEAVHLYAERERAMQDGRRLDVALFGFPLF
jgi:hypothetical protein